MTGVGGADWSQPPCSLTKINNNILYFCKKAADMTAKLIRYIGFSFYNCLEITV